MKLSEKLKDPSWKAALEPEFQKPYFLDLQVFLAKAKAEGKEIYPPLDLVFAALNITPLNAVRVVILGQDPYHRPRQANGLCFSVQEGVRHPPSLKNILKELGEKRETSGNLTSWAQQGVLLLNCIMTVEEGAPGSHKKKGWEKFTDKIITLVDETAKTNSKSLAFVFWGRYAQKKEKLLQKKENLLSPGHFLIKTAHPSPRSCNRETCNGRFVGSRPFEKVNKYLKSKNDEPIDWSLRNNLSQR